MNTHLAPFDNAQGAPGGELGDRPQRAWSTCSAGRPGPPVCQVLPPGFPGHVDYCPYTKDPGAQVDGARHGQGQAARQAVGHRRPGGRHRRIRRRGQQAIGVYLQSVLNDRATRPASRRSRPTSSSPTSRTPTTRCRSASRSGTRTTRRPRTSSTSCSAAIRSAKAATSASTSPASATRRSTPRCRRRCQLGVDRPGRPPTSCGPRSTERHGRRRRPCLFTPKHRRLRLEARRQFPVQRAVLLHRRPGPG